MLSTLTIALVLSGQIGDAPDRLITEQGIELSQDGRIFVFFAALNALGYSYETEHEKPPLQSPVFHPVRKQTREALRKLEQGGKLEGVRRFVQKHPAPIEAYLAAILAHDLGLTAAKSIPASGKKVAGIVKELKKVGTDPEVIALSDALALDQRRFAKELKGRLEKDFQVARNFLGDNGFVGPNDLIVIPNPLDAHAAVRTVSVGGATYLVVGPGYPTAQTAILGAALQPLATGWAKEGFARSPKLKAAWAGLKGSRRITGRYGSGESYLAATLAHAVAFKIHRKADPKSSFGEDDFVDAQNRKRLRWSRAALSAIGSTSSGFSRAAGKVIGRLSP